MLLDWRGDRPDESSGSAPLHDLDIGGLAERLEALDAELDRRDAAPEAPALDLSGAREALAALAPLDQGAPAPWVAEREATLAAIEREIAIRLGAGGDPVLLSQGLQRLEECVLLPPRFTHPVPDGLVAAGARFDEALAAARQEAARIIAVETGLTLMPDQTGERIDPGKHSVVGTETGPEASRNNTVSAQESSGWLMEGDVLVPARVVRYTSAGVDVPAVPATATDDVDLDDSIFGRKRDE